jgi:hypothetical protein
MSEELYREEHELAFAQIKAGVPPEAHEPACEQLQAERTIEVASEVLKGNELPDTPK